MKAFIFQLVSIFLLTLSLNCTATNYNIGPDQNLKELDEVPWLTLKAGDTVYIYGRNTPYNHKIGLNGVGTPDSPISIIGVKGLNGTYPILSGINAKTPKNLSGFFDAKWDEANALILIKRSRDQKWGTKPSNIIIENITITGASNQYSFIDQYGKQRPYVASAAGIWVNLVDGLLVKNCHFIDNGNGFFVLSKGSEEVVSRNITIEGNVFSNNGVADSYRQHNIYAQAANVTIQNNLFNSLRPYALGAAIKDRSSGTVIRYNKIFAGAYALDLVDPEDSANILTKEPNFHDTWVYGNIIISAANNENRPYASRLIHYGGDSGIYDMYRKGTLHFSYNTIFLDIYASHETFPLRWRTAIFVMDTNEESVAASNNIIYSHGNTHLSWLSGNGNITLSGTNWINASTIVAADNKEFLGSYKNIGKLILGDDVGFSDWQNYDFRIRNESSAIHSSTLSVTNDLEPHLIKFQYADLAKKTQRNTTNIPENIGALKDSVTLTTPYDNSNEVIISSGYYNTWPRATWGNFTQPVDGIAQVFPAPLTHINLNESIEVEFTEPMLFQWTDNRFFQVFDENNKKIAAIDLLPGNSKEGTKKLTFSLAELGINKAGLYHIVIDASFARFNLPPYRSGRVENSQWYFAVSDNSQTKLVNTWGVLQTKVNGISKIYPAPQSNISMNNFIQIEFDSTTNYLWTQNYFFKVYDINANLIKEIDLIPGDRQEGTKLLSFSLAELGINNPGDYSISIDRGFVKLNSFPWRNSELLASQWQFSVVCSINCNIMH